MSRHLSPNPNNNNYDTAGLQLDRLKGEFYSRSPFQFLPFRIRFPARERLNSTAQPRTVPSDLDLVRFAAEEDTAGAPQSQTPLSLRKLAMSHLMGAALSANVTSSPKIHAANGDGRNDSSNEKAQPQYGALPPPGAPALASALKTLTSMGSVTSHPRTGVQYDSPYSRSISSTAPASPRM